MSLRLFALFSLHRRVYEIHYNVESLRLRISYGFLLGIWAFQYEIEVTKMSPSTTNTPAIDVPTYPVTVGWNPKFKFYCRLLVNAVALYKKTISLSLPRNYNSTSDGIEKYVSFFAFFFFFLSFLAAYFTYTYIWHKSAVRVTAKNFLRRFSFRAAVRFFSFARH